MKQYKRNYPAYPNAASQAYVKARALDVLTGILSGAGLLLAFLYFMLL